MLYVPGRSAGREHSTADAFTNETGVVGVKPATEHFSPLGLKFLPTTTTLEAAKGINDVGTT